MGVFSWLIRTFQPWTKHRRGPLTAQLPRRRFGQDRYRPEGAWVQITNVVYVVGIQHRRNQVEEYCLAVATAERSGGIYGVRLRPEPDNVADRNAIAVDGFANGRIWHIGYLDRETAAELTRDFVAKGTPINAELYAIWISKNGYIEIRIIALAPSEKRNKRRSTPRAKSAPAGA